jgi:hypothetical protein
LDDILSYIELFFCKYHALADNFRPSQSKQPNFDYPQMHKISYIYLFAIVPEDLNRMAQQIHFQSAQVANEAGEDALQSMGI